MPHGFDKCAPVPFARLAFALVIFDVCPSWFDPLLAPRAPMAPLELFAGPPLFCQLVRLLVTLASQERVAVPTVMEALFELGDEVAVLPALVKEQHLHRFFLSVRRVCTTQHERHVRKVDPVFFDVMPVAWHQSPQRLAGCQHRFKPSLHPLGRGRISLRDGQHRARLLGNGPAYQRLQRRAFACARAGLDEGLAARGIGKVPKDIVPPRGCVPIKMRRARRVREPDMALQPVNRIARVGEANVSSGGFKPVPDVVRRFLDRLRNVQSWPLR